MSFSLDAFAGRIAALVAAQSASAWLVGGYVRDRLLGRTSHDLDLIVPEGGIRLARSLARALNGASFVLDEDRDVGRAILRDEGGEAIEVDVARLRAPDLFEDLSLRDFTINAMAVALHRDGSDAEVIDPFDGQSDLQHGLVRAVTEGAFRDDPLRMLRAVRHSVELGFRIEDATHNLIRRDAALLSSVAAERVRDELMRIIPAPGAWQHVRLLASLDLLQPTLPEAAALIGVGQSAPHYQDVFHHTRSVMAHLEGIFAILWPEGRYRAPEPLADDATVLADAAQWAEVAEALAPFAEDLRRHLSQPLATGRTRRDGLFWAALAHDWGKPAMRTVEPDGRIRFLGHERWGALLAERRSQALRLSGDETAYLFRLVDQHMRPGQLAHDGLPGRRAIYRYFRDLAGDGPDCVLLSLADHLAIHAPRPDPDYRRQRLETVRLLLETFFREPVARLAPPPLLDGHQIMAEFGLKPGPQIGVLLEELREAQAVGEVGDVEEARIWLARRLAEVH